MYFEPLIHALSSREGPVEFFFYLKSTQHAVHWHSGTFTYHKNILKLPISLHAKTTVWFLVLSGIFHKISNPDKPKYVHTLNPQKRRARLILFLRVQM